MKSTRAHRHRITAQAALIGLVVLAMRCTTSEGDQSPTAPNTDHIIESITISEGTSMMVEAGRAANISAVANFTGDSSMPAVGAKWTSDNTAVASVSFSGALVTIRAVSPGTAMVWVDFMGMRESIKVTVYQHGAGPPGVTNFPFPSQTEMQFSDDFESGDLDAWTWEIDPDGIGAVRRDAADAFAGEWFYEIKGIGGNPNGASVNIRTKPFSETYFGGWFWMNEGYATDVGENLVMTAHGDGIVKVRIQLKQDGLDSISINAITTNPKRTLASSEGGAVPKGSWFRVDVYWRNGASGGMRLWLNRVLVGEDFGENLVGVALDEFRFGFFGNPVRRGDVGRVDNPEIYVLTGVDEPLESSVN